MLVKDFVKWATDESKEILHEIDEIYDDRKKSGGIISKKLKEKDAKLKNRHHRYKGYRDGYIAGIEGALQDPESAKKFLQFDEAYFKQITSEEG